MCRMKCVIVLVMVNIRIQIIGRRALVALWSWSQTVRFFEYLAKVLKRMAIKNGSMSLQDDYPMLAWA